MAAPVRLSSPLVTGRAGSQGRQLPCTRMELGYVTRTHLRNQLWWSPLGQILFTWASSLLRASRKLKTNGMGPGGIAEQPL